MCTDVRFKAVDNKLTWRIGHCTNGLYSSSNEGKKVNTDRCCLAPGIYTLMCSSDNKYSWRQGHVEIQGVKYCNDFIGYMAMRRIEIFGKIRIK